THPVKPWITTADLRADMRYVAKMSARNHCVSVAKAQNDVVNPTNLCRALDDGVQDRLHVRRRAANDAEHLGGCGLRLQGFAQFCVAFLDFFEQPHVLDSDHRLVGEGLKENDLLVSEGSYLRSADHNRADSKTLPQQRCG